MKYKVGDRVLIRNDLEDGGNYLSDDGYDEWANRDMANMAGTWVTISKIIGSEYHIEESPEWYWVDGMFSDLSIEDDDFEDTEEMDSFIKNLFILTD